MNVSSPVGCVFLLSHTHAARPCATAAKNITLFGLTVPFMVYLFTGSMLFHLYNQTSYQALGELQPLDISVARVSSDRAACFLKAAAAALTHLVHIGPFIGPFIGPSVH